MTDSYVKLESRVDALDKSIANIDHTLITLSAKFDAKTPGIAALESRVSGLEKGLNDVSDAIGNLASEIRANSKTPWGNIWSAIGVSVTIILAIGTLAYRPVEASVERLERQMGGLEDKLVPRHEHQQRWDVQQNSANRLQALIDRNYDLLSRRIDLLERKPK